MSGKIRLYSGTVAIEARGFVKSGIDTHTVVILVIGKLKQEDQEFRAISGEGGGSVGKTTCYTSMRTHVQTPRMCVKTKGQDWWHATSVTLSWGMLRQKDC